MMLRFIYFVSLLLSLSLSEEEFLRPGKRHLRSCYKRGKINRKRENYNTFDDKESMDLIDVASFIQNRDDNSFEGNQGSENRIPVLNNGDDGSIMNVEIESIPSQDYQGLDSDNIPEMNIQTNRRIPKYLNRKSRPVEKINGERVLKTNENKNSDDLFDNNIKNRHIEKKCALKNMKFPFFSRDKASTTKGKKNKKRKLFSFHNEKKNLTKPSEADLNNNINKVINGKRKSIKINKRSNIEGLCPACKQRYLFDTNDFLNNLRNTANSGIHNSRQYYQQKHFEEAEPDSTEQPNSFQLKNQNTNLDNEDINYVNSKKWKRNNSISKNKIN
ncbi:MATH and LRR domain-containing protein PFE0570w-like [Vanessa atalanta]|uniref:MATH and LRR domain-containing protein PFE0570w-like n=1 Tax=Vanessa atalanta TaxID=42275 RepID=UPI001FCD26C5|nr:MATH and LRR domain-containing protein PFE0570w-like [Vanessa atalanta]